MKLKVIAIEGKGDINKEVVWLEAIEACNVKFYILCDNTYTDDKHISNELRHMHWFHEADIKKGDLVALYTKDGKNSSIANNRGTTTYLRYWKLGKTVWNKTGDCAVVFEVNDWATTRAL